MNTLLILLALAAPVNPEVIHTELLSCEGLSAGDVVLVVNNGQPYKVKILDVHGDCHVNLVVLEVIDNE